MSNSPIPSRSYRPDQANPTGPAISSPWHQLPCPDVGGQDPAADLARPRSRIFDHPQDFGPAKVVDDYAPHGSTYAGRTVGIQVFLLAPAGSFNPVFLQLETSSTRIGSQAIGWRDVGIVARAPYAH
jgi:hypothetical protein